MASAEGFQRRTFQGLLILGDLLAIFLIFIFMHGFRWSFDEVPQYAEALLGSRYFLSTTIILVISHYIFDLYEPRHWRSPLFSPARIIVAILFTVLIVLSVHFILGTPRSGVVGRGVFLGAMTLFTFWSLGFRYFVYKAQLKNSQKNNFLVVSSRKCFESFCEDFKASSKNALHGGITWVDIADESAVTKKLDHVEGEAWSVILVEGSLSSSLTRRVMEIRLSGQKVLSFQNFYELYFAKVPVFSLSNSWFAFTEGFTILHSQINMRLKRVSDVLISTLMLIPGVPLMGLLAVLIRLESRGPAIYKQARVGAGGEVFTIYKFRSMKADAEKDGAKWAAKKDPRVTFLGRIMRKTRLDELPQLFNILKGDMSFIGPRPERPEFTESLKKSIPFYDLRHLIKPGLSGWAQVMYPYGASEKDAIEKLQYDLYYIKNYSLELDVKIFFKTISVVLFGMGR